MPDTLLLCYHALSITWSAPLSVRPDQFRQQIEMLLGRGYRGSSFTSAATQTDEEPTFAVTFDDGFRSVLDLAKPILDDLEVPATVFVPSAFPDDRPLAWDGITQWRGTEHEHELACLGWDELRGLADEGWEIGAHTVTHPRLTTVADRDLERELTDARLCCAQEMGRPCTSLAYPYGDVDERVEAAAEAAGYTVAADLSPRFFDDRPLRVSRVGVYNGDSLERFALKCAQPVRWLRRRGLWPGSR